jgi:hypothetical protein
MKRLAHLSFAIATLIAPIQAHAQQYDAARNCVRFPQQANPAAETQYLLAHPNIPVCPSSNPDRAGQAGVLDQISRDRVNNTRTQICAMNGQRC